MFTAITNIFIKWSERLQLDCKKYCLDRINNTFTFRKI